MYRLCSGPVEFFDDSALPDEFWEETTLLGRMVVGCFETGAVRTNDDVRSWFSLWAYGNAGERKSAWQLTLMSSYPSTGDHEGRFFEGPTDCSRLPSHGSKFGLYGRSNTTHTVKHLCINHMSPL